MPPNSTYLTGRTMLFDLESDMFEQHDVAAEYPEVAAKLLARLQQYNDTYCGGARCLPDKHRPGMGPPGVPANDPAVMGQTPVWLPWRGDPNPAACSTDRRPPGPPPYPGSELHSHVSQLQLQATASGPVLLGNFWCFDAAWPGGGVSPMTVQLSVDGVVVERVVANASRPPGFTNASGAPNAEHGYYFREHSDWVKLLAGPGKHRLDLDVFLDPSPTQNSSTMPLNQSPVCTVGGNITSSGNACRALVPPPGPAPPHPADN